MEKWVAIVLGLLVIVIGFIVIQNIQESVSTLPGIGQQAECQIRGGTCVELAFGCSERIDETLCGEGWVCCEDG